MRILLSHRYFWPDTPPYARILRGIALALVERGHSVEVFSCQPSYLSHAPNEIPAIDVSDGMRVTRIPMPVEKGASVPMRALSALRYARELRRHILREPRYDVVMAATFPPLVAARAASAAKRTGAKFVYHFQDIHPEVGRASGVSRNMPLYALQRWFDTQTLAKADAAVVLSDDMANTLRARGNNVPPIHIINNFLPASGGEKLASERPSSDDPFMLIFAGNIGVFQGLDDIVAAARLLRDEPRIQFRFIGEGAAKKRLMSAATGLEGTVQFLPHVTADRASAYMAEASLNIVSLSPGVFRVSYPSKAIAALSLGAPLLVVMEEESELSGMVRAESIGFTAPPGDPSRLAAAIRDAFVRRDELNAMRRRAHELVAKRFSERILLNKWIALMEGLGTNTETTRKSGD